LDHLYSEKYFGLQKTTVISDKLYLLWLARLNGVYKTHKFIFSLPDTLNTHSALIKVHFNYIEEGWAEHMHDSLLAKTPI